MFKIASVIKYDKNENDTLIYKYPEEDFNTNSQLIVHESQEVIFYMHGQSQDLFGPGLHTLETENIPLISKILNLPYGGKSPFHCEVYFINKAESLETKWGVPEITYIDPTLNGYAFTIGIRGTMSIRVQNSRKLVNKLVGTGTKLDRDSLADYFRVPISMYIKSVLPSVLKESNLSIYEVESNLMNISQSLKQQIAPLMDEYGIYLDKFWIEGIKKPEDNELYAKVNKQKGEKITIFQQGELDRQQARNAADVEVIKYTAEDAKRRMDIERQRYEQEQLQYSYQQRRGYDVMQDVAKNEGSGSDLRNAAMGLGMGFPIGNKMGQMASSLVGATVDNTLNGGMNPVNNDSQNSANVSNTVQKTDDMAAFKQKVEKLKIMLDAGLLTEEEFNQQKTAIINQILG